MENYVLVLLIHGYCLSLLMARCIKQMLPMHQEQCCIILILFNGMKRCCDCLIFQHLYCLKYAPAAKSTVILTRYLQQPRFRYVGLQAISRRHYLGRCAYNPEWLKTRMAPVVLC